MCILENGNISGTEVMTEGINFQPDSLCKAIKIKPSMLVREAIKTSPVMFINIDIKPHIPFTTFCYKVNLHWMILHYNYTYMTLHH